MIPKKIHYCWFGGNPLPKDAKKCIESWKKYFPDCEIIEWNESNFDINYNKYTQQAYQCKKFAFVSDVARLYIIEKYGGIYFDVDVETIKKYDDINDCDAFYGIEKEGHVNTGLGFGSKKNNKLLKKMLKDYDNIKFINEDGTLNLTPCPEINSKIFLDYGFTLDNKKNEEIDKIRVYKTEYFNPLENSTGKLKITNNTHSIHWYKKSWVPKRKVIISKITKPFHRIFGPSCFKKIKRILKIK